MPRPHTLSRRELVLGSAALASTLAFATAPRAGARTSRVQAPATPATGSLEQVAVGAYVFGYPLVLMDVTRQQLTAVPAPTNRQAPVNQFTHAPRFPDHTFESVVSPNVDALYSTAWLDLGPEPMVLSLPDTSGRYYLMQVLDAWTNVFASPGTRTTGPGAGDYALVGPGWTGTLPPGVTPFQSPTAMAWIIGRTETKGEADYDAVHALQAQYTLTPLSAWGEAYTPPAEVPVDSTADTTTAPADQVAGMTPEVFWTRFAAGMVENPPAPADAPLVTQLAQIGIVPGQALDWSSLTPAQATALEAGLTAGLAQVEAAGQSPPTQLRNGWAIAYGLGNYGTNYMVRAAVAWVGLGANLPEDGIYPTTRVDSTGEPLSGANRYLLHFAADQLPPVDGFWSLTMYNSRQHFVENPIGRYAIRDGDALKLGTDGSLEILIQHESPGADQESNWLPAPADAFNLMMRLYWPKPQVLDGSWIPPAVTKVN